ncbi:MAG TPA: polysaccharide biosynthesis/export family protein [Rhizomicrobium sp.]|nr:polysaccharide biosynthesis/export family protein [Rhizomicrobium sp.]
MAALRRCVLAGASLLAGLTASAHAQDAPPPLKGFEDDTIVVTAQRTSSDYRFGPGDKLRVTVYGEDDLSGEFQIDGAGYIRLPLIGQIKASGATAHELETEVAQTLDDGYLTDARVAIEVTTYRPFYIIGQVSKPGEYPYVSNMSALNAVALAGGFTEKAMDSTIYVRHEGEVDEREITMNELVRIEPGDVVRVPETTFWRVVDVLSPLTGFGYVAAQAAGP